MTKSIKLPFSRPLRSIAPTSFTELRECALKSVWRLSGNPPLLPRSPKARVGTVAHRLISEAGQGLHKAEGATIGSRWDELIALANGEIGSSLLERHLNPLTQSAPDIAVRRIRATRKALDIASAFRTPQLEGERPTSYRRYGHEIRIQSTDGIVKGTIDVVTVGVGTGAIIQDYKSGSILESDSESEYRPKESYQVQLKMYAGLYAETYGEWPVSLELVPLSGITTEVPFTRSECSNLLAEAKAALRATNEAIANHPSDSLPSLLASPSPRACAFCQYRPACESYRLVTSRSDSEGWPLDVSGTVVSVRQLGNSKLMLEIATAGGPVKIPGLTPGDRHPALQALKPGDVAGVFNLRRSRPTAPYAESQMTTVHQLPKAQGFQP